MDRADVAEWLLRRVADPDRASEIVGDTLQTHPERGSFGFWFSIAWLVVLFSWRTILSTVLSPVAGLSLALLLFSFRNLDSITDGAFHIHWYLLGINIVLWMATFVSLIRLGYRNVYTAISLALSLLGSITMNFFWLPYAPLPLSAAALGLLFVCLINPKKRRALAGLLCTVLVSWLAAFLISLIAPDHRSVFSKTAGLIALFLVPIVESSAVSFFYHRLVEKAEASKDQQVIRGS